MTDPPCEGKSTVKRTCAVIALIVLIPCAAALAQAEPPAPEQAPKPWETWQPPAVEMPDPNAFELYELAFALYDRISKADQPAPAPQQGGEGAVVQAPPRPEADFGRSGLLTTGELNALCEEYAPVFRLLEEAIAGETQFPPLTDPAQPMPYLAGIRQAARMFGDRSLLRREQGRPLEAALDAIACIHLAADAATQGSLISGLVQVACSTIGEAQLREVILLLDGTEARAATNALRRAMAQRVDFAEIVAGETVVIRAFFKAIEPALGDENEMQGIMGEETAQELLAQGLPTPETTWEQMAQFNEQATAWARQPFWARGEKPPATPDNPLLNLLLPAYAQASFRYAVSDARLAVYLAAIAAQAYLGENGAYPTDLESLVPDYLPEVPRDPFVDAPLRSEFHAPVTRAHPASGHEPTGEGVLAIYSVGPDGDDDGGADIGPSVKADSDGDIAITLAAE